MIKLNLGCGTAWETGQEWLNIDTDKLIPPENAAFIRHDIRTVEDLLQPKSAEYIKVHHTLETLWIYDAKEFLAACVRLLKPGGYLEIQMREIDRMVEQTREADPDTVFGIWYGQSSKRGDGITGAWREKDLTAYLKTLGLVLQSNTGVDSLSLLLIYKKP